MQASNMTTIAAAARATLFQRLRNRILSYRNGGKNKKTPNVGLLYSKSCSVSCNLQQDVISHTRQVTASRLTHGACASHVIAIA